MKAPPKAVRMDSISAVSKRVRAAAHASSANRKLAKLLLVVTEIEVMCVALDRRLGFGLLIQRQLDDEALK
jgi:hypothetical protein